MNPYDILINNARVLSMEPGQDDEKACALAVKDGVIRQLFLPGAPLPPAERVIDAEGGIVMPGLINCHSHVPMSLLRGLGDDMALAQWLNEVIFPAEARFLSPGFVSLGSELALAEMLLSGTTCICDGYFFEHNVAEAVLKAGMRSVLGQGIIGFPAPGAPDPAKNVEVAADFVSAWKGKSPLITPSFFCHSPYTCSAETLVRAKEKSRELGVPFQIHVSETAREVKDSREQKGMSPVAYLDSLGVLDASTLLVHAVHADEADRELIARRGCGVAVSTGSEMKLASGVAPLPEYLALGVPAGLGTDGSSSSNRLCMFREMDLTAKLHKVDKKDPTALPATETLALATRNAARAIGMGKLIGSLAPGKQADIVVMQADRPHLTPCYDPASALVYAATGKDVRHVIIGGKMVVEESLLLTMDMAEVLARARAMGERIRAEMQ